MTDHEKILTTTEPIDMSDNLLNELSEYVNANIDTEPIISDRENHERYRKWKESLDQQVMARKRYQQKIKEYLTENPRATFNELVERACNIPIQIGLDTHKLARLVKGAIDKLYWNDEITSVVVYETKKKGE